MKELQKSFKKLLLLETGARDLYLGILERNIEDEEIIRRIELIKKTRRREKNEPEVGHMLMAKELIKMSAIAESRKKKPYFSKKDIDSLEGDIILKRNLLYSIAKLLDAKVRTFTLLGLLGREAFKFKKADKARQELTGIIAHQLKTPLTTSNWISELFLKKKEGELTEDEKGMIREIMASNKIMFSIYKNIS